MVTQAFRKIVHARIGTFIALVATLTKALYEVLICIETLEAQIEALKSA